jgi:NADPH2:quinone reductase
MLESYPAKIKAVGINETGGVEVIQNLEVPFPEIKPTDLLIKVLCYTDIVIIVIALRFILYCPSGRMGRRQLHRCL